LIAITLIPRRLTAQLLKIALLRASYYLNLIFQSYEYKEDFDGLVDTLEVRQAMDFKAAFTRTTVGRRFCQMHGGRFGLVAPNVKNGDLVCILYGDNVPFLLHPVLFNMALNPSICWSESVICIR
jgi:hypothetical protein